MMAQLTVRKPVVEGLLTCFKGQEMLISSSSEQSDGEEALLSDLLRRSGQFEKAIIICNQGLNNNPEGIINDILRFEKTLIEQEDTSCHSVSEA